MYHANDRCMRQDYPPIESYGMVGNLDTVALIGHNGSVDFYCYPEFDSPTVFARLLDRRRGGYFQIRPQANDWTERQMYLPDTNVLVTRFLSMNGILEIVDFMPLTWKSSRNQLVRIVKSVHGDIDVVMECFPAFDYGRATMSAVPEDDRRSVRFESDRPDLSPARLYSDVELDVRDGGAMRRFVLHENQQAVFAYLCDATESGAFQLEMVDEVLQETAQFWREWIAGTEYHGFAEDHVRRSALALKLLISRRHGSMVAAPTFGLPEAIGGARNWDYRYCWIRDSAFTVHALLKLGFRDEASRYIEWIAKRYESSAADGSLNVMYRVSGGDTLEEVELDHLEGYKGSRPVRIGNAANRQLQLDIYGELIDSIYLAHKYSSPMSYAGWEQLRRTVEYVCENWERPDEGIWEFRGGVRHFLHSKLMCWVAIDRALKLSLLASLPAPVDRWRKERDRVFQSVHEEFWDPELEAFVQYRGAKNVDASVLLMPMVRFISPIDPRWLSTMEAVSRELVVDAFVHRYDKDAVDFEGLDGSEEGSFTTCSFWYCECLARCGQVDKARLLFEKMTGYANHVGLYAEELGFDARHLGNFPQAFTHLALISAAAAIDRAMREHQPF
jgi:GH15 family glucan-1,4-alpha-glucosidase